MKTTEGWSGLGSRGCPNGLGCELCPLEWALGHRSMLLAFLLSRSMCIWREPEGPEWMGTL